MTPEQVEREDPIREAVTAHWGERCPGDPDPSDKDCVICRVWAQLDRYEAQAARIRELEEALRLAHIRIGICADRMEGCNAIGGDHQLIDEVREWESDARAVLQGEAK